MQAQGPRWTGVYVGGNLGYVWGDTDIEGSANDLFTTYQPFVNTNADTRLKPDGFAGGLKAGGNYQLGQVVFGAEVSYDWLDADDSRQTDFLSPGPGDVPGSFYDKVKIEDLFTIRGRVGLAVDYAFVYVTGGYASADVQREQALIFTNGNNFIASGSERKDGWVYGGGFEYNLFGGWSLTTEFLHIELDDDTLVAPNLPAFPLDQTVTTNAETSFDVVRAGLTYRFW